MSGAAARAHRRAAAPAAAGHALAPGRRAPRLARGRPALDLVVTLDDATSESLGLPGGRGGTASSFRALAEVIADKGLFCALYTDRGGHYFHTPVAGGGVDRQHPTQVAARWRSSVSSISPPIRRRRAAARSGSSARWRTGCPRSSRSPGSARSTLPTPGCARTTCPRTTPASPWPRKNPAPPSSPFSPEQCRQVLCLQETRQVATTTPCAAGRSLHPKARSGPTSCVLTCGCTNTPTRYRAVLGAASHRRHPASRGSTR